MHPFDTQPLATERRAGSLHDAAQTGLDASANRTATARLRVRVLEAADRQRLGDLYNLLSPRSRYLRFMSPIHKVPESVLQHLAGIDHDSHEAVGAFDRASLIASAHWFRSPHQSSRAELAIEVADHYQRRGVGTRLLRVLGRRARTQGIVEFGATVLAENIAALALIRTIGWPSASTFDGPELTIAMAIAGTSKV
jgi:GNAT superfamily N-acetyltransferase